MSFASGSSSYLYFQLASPHSVSYFFIKHWSPYSSLLSFDTVLSSIGNILPVNDSANILVIGDFSISHNDYLNCSDGPQVFNLPNWISDCDGHFPSLFYSFLASDLVFVLQLSCLHQGVLIVVLIQFLLTYLLTQRLIFIAHLLIILTQIGRFCMKISDTLHWMIYYILTRVLLLIINLFSLFKLEFMCISLNEKVLG